MYTLYTLGSVFSSIARRPRPGKNICLIFINLYPDIFFCAHSYFFLYRECILKSTLDTVSPQTNFLLLPSSSYNFNFEFSNIKFKSSVHSPVRYLSKRICYWSLVLVLPVLTRLSFYFTSKVHISLGGLQI